MCIFLLYVNQDKGLASRTTRGKRHDYPKQWTSLICLYFHQHTYPLPARIKARIIAWRQKLVHMNLLMEALMFISHWLVANSTLNADKTKYILFCIQNTTLEVNIINAYFSQPLPVTAKVLVKPKPYPILRSLLTIISPSQRICRICFKKLGNVSLPGNR